VSPTGRERKKKRKREKGKKRGGWIATSIMLNETFM